MTVFTGLLCLFLSFSLLSEKHLDAEKYYHENMNLSTNNFLKRSSIPNKVNTELQTGTHPCCIILSFIIILVF